MSTVELAPGLRAADRSARTSPGAWLLGAALAACVGLSSVFTAALFVESYSPGVTRGRKRELVAELLPAAIPALAALAAVALVLAVLRRGSLQSALRGDRARRDGLARRALRVAVLAAVLALATPLLQALVGLSPELAPSRLFASPARAATSTLGVLSAALQEDVLLRWLPLELVLLAGLALGRRRAAGLVLVAVALSLSTALAVLAHAAHELAPPTLEMLVRYGLPKAPAALVLACVYLRRGLVEAWLTHGATNLAILVLLPALVGNPSLTVTP